MTTTTVVVTEIVLLSVLISIHLVLIKISNTVNRNRECPGYLNLAKGQCTADGKHYLSFKERSADCNPPVEHLKRRDIILFAGKLALEYLKHDDDDEASLFWYLRTHTPTLLASSFTLYRGIFYFLLKPFLTVLPTNFGQNFITPYGTPSFLADYLTCVPDIRMVCEDLLNSPENVVTCQRYFDDMKQYFANPVPNCAARDPELFHDTLYVELGLLGAMTITPTQGILLSGVIPRDVGLEYWSFTPYLADRYHKNDKCSPYHHIYFSSLTDPFNTFTRYTTAHEFRFAIVTTINPVVGDELYRTLIESGRYDYVHRFDLPSGDRSMIVQEGLLNPNGLTSEMAAFWYETDRLAILFRMNVRDPSSQSFRRFKLNPGFETVLVDVTTVPEIRFYEGVHPPLKTPTPLQTDESAGFQQHRNEIEGKLLKTILRDSHAPKTIHCFDSLLGTFAPLDNKVYNNTYTYTSGRQAIQMASNANGDNPDAWYKISQPQCMGHDDVMVAIAVNHTILKNSVYCNINVLAKQIGRGIASVEMYEDDPDERKRTCPFYGVVISRNAELVRQTIDHIYQQFGEDEIYLFGHTITTGTTTEWEVPMCYQLLFIERAYLNPTILDDGGEWRHYKDVKDTRLWSRMTRPDGKQLVHPIFIKYTRSNPYYYYYLVSMIVILILIILILLPHYK